LYATRARWCTAAVSVCFCGHYHRNAGGVYEQPDGRRAEVVVTGACGTNVSTRETGNPLEIEGMGTCREVSDEVSGMRLVCVGETSVDHAWYTFRDLHGVAALSPAVVGAREEAREEASEEASPRKRRRVQA
jgi:hypothetical protein